MRSYPRNSPQAAARVLALVLISDGNVCRTELDTLSRHADLRNLGLDPQQLHGIVRTLCEDLLMEGFDGRSVLTRVGDDWLARLVSEVDAPHLQAQVMRLAALAVQADQHLSESEVAMIDAIRHIWNQGPHAAHAAPVQINRLPLYRAGSAW